MFFCGTAWKGDVFSRDKPRKSDVFVPFLASPQWNKGDVRSEFAVEW